MGLYVTLHWFNHTHIYNTRWSTEHVWFVYRDMLPLCMKPSNWMTILNPSPSKAQRLKSEDPSREAIVQYQLLVHPLRVTSRPITWQKHPFIVTLSEDNNAPRGNYTAARNTARCSLSLHPTRQQITTKMTGYILGSWQNPISIRLKPRNRTWTFFHFSKERESVKIPWNDSSLFQTIFRVRVKLSMPTFQNSIVAESPREQ
jgi:hypothetical protein